jgi:hypothetical protein
VGAAHDRKTAHPHKSRNSQYISTRAVEELRRLDSIDRQKRLNDLIDE